MPVKRYLPGDTIQLTWIDSGVSIDSSSAYILSGSETIITSGSALVSSGNGHYYLDYTIPNTLAGFYNARTVVVVGGKPYIRQEPFMIIPLEVD